MAEGDGGRGSWLEPGEANLGLGHAFGADSLLELLAPHVDGSRDAFHSPWQEPLLGVGRTGVTIAGTPCILSRLGPILGVRPTEMVIPDEKIRSSQLRLTKPTKSSHDPLWHPCSPCCPCVHRSSYHSVPRHPRLHPPISKIPHARCSPSPSPVSTPAEAKVPSRPRPRKPRRFPSPIPHHPRRLFLHPAGTVVRDALSSLVPIANPSHWLWISLRNIWSGMFHSSVGFAGAGRNHDVGFYFPRYTDTVSFLTYAALVAKGER